MQDVGQSKIPVCRPLLPDPKSLAPFLERISAARWYSNYGAVYGEFRSGLADLLATDPRHLVLVSNATIGLMLALAARTRGRQGLCMLPSWTFPASAAAAHWAGLTPWFIDIDPDAWALTPELAKAALPDAPGPVVAAMPVSPFGSPLPVDRWATFEDETGIPVVVDAAASVDTLVPADIPAALSLHATKALGIGEGGAVVCTDEALVNQVQRLSNFGLREDRISYVPGLNGKISEYTAAVGLAALEAWPEQRRHVIDVAGYYVAELGDRIRFPPGFATFASSTCVAWLDGIDRETVSAHMAARGIETLPWWGKAIPDHDAYSDAPVHGLAVARRAARETIGLPMSPTLSRADATRVIDALTELCPVNNMRSAGISRSAANE